MHESVLLIECLNYLSLKDDSIVVDATLGYGGHSSHILKKIPKGFLYSFDQDSDAVISSQKRLSQIKTNFEIINTNFVNLKEELAKRNITSVGAILFDLGVSSPQLDVAERGFSYKEDARLDMRMNQSESLSAYEVVNTYAYEDLVKIFKEYGEEEYASSIARKIIEARYLKNIETTLELSDIIASSVPFKYKRLKHPARKVFQAIRIEVNNELEVLTKALKDALELLNVGGRLCVITFHSLEDKICKDIFKEASKIPASLNNLPIIPEEYKPSFKVIANVLPTKDEIENNRRARSAKLRVIERIKR